MWRAIWNGPFYIGPLSRPVTVGEVLMKVLETIWRAAIVIVVVFAALFAWLWMQDRANQRAIEAAERTTEVAARYDLERCNPLTPIHVTVGNRGRRTLTWVSYTIEVLDRPGGSNVAPSRLSNLTVSQSLPPGQGLTFCHSLADYSGTPLQLRPEMVVVGKLNHVSVQ